MTVLGRLQDRVASDSEVDRPADRDVDRDSHAIFKRFVVDEWLSDPIKHAIPAGNGHRKRYRPRLHGIRVISGTD